MAMSEHRAETLDDVFDVIRSASHSGEMACRGEPRHFQGTRSKIDRLLDRLNRSSEERAMAEKLAIMRFVDQAAVHCTPVELTYIHDRVLSILALMQHYGAPTRIVDWSLSPWVAVYYACHKDPDHDGVVYLFNLKLVVNTIRKTTERQSTAMLSIPSSDLDGWESAALTAGDWINPVTMRVSNQRMIAQRGLFTVAGKVNTDHIRLIDRYSPTDAPLIRLVIPSKLKTPLMRQLVGMNITPASLFPGIEGVSRALEQTLELSLPIVFR